MELKEVTASEAAKDFVRHVWPTLFAGDRKGSSAPYSRVRAFVTAVKAGKETEAWTIRILTQYGGGRYRITTKFQIQQPEPEGPDRAGTP